MRFRSPIAALGLLTAALFTAAFARADNFALRLPRTPTQELNDAIALLRQGKVHEADAQFGRIGATDPAFLTATLGRAQIAADDRRLNDAQHLLDAVLHQQPKLPEAHDLQGVLLLLRKDTPGARREFERALDLAPQYVTPRVYLAVLDRTSGDLLGAIAEYKALIATAPRLPVGYLGAAEAYFRLRREPEGFAVLQAWKQADPHTLAPYQLAARVHLADGQPQPALAEAQAALHLRPHDAPTLALLADIDEATGDLVAAGRTYNAALTADPANAEALLGLAGLEAQAGQTASAVRRYRSVLARDPNNPVVTNDLAWTLAVQGASLAEALSLAERAVHLSPTYADARDTLGWIHYRRGDTAAAVAALQAAKQLAPANPEIAAHLGLALAKAGKRQDALFELQRALRSGRPLAAQAEVEQTARYLQAHT